MNELLRRLLFLPPQASTVAAGIDGLHYFVIITTMAGAGLITLAGALLLIRYRARGPLGAGEAYAPAPRPPLWAELGLVAALFGLFTLWWLIGFLQYVRIRVPPADTVDVYVTAKQWMWQFAYPDGHHSIAALYVPSGRPVKLIMTSRDVIHSFFVPDFRLKQDVIPGRYTTLWFTAKAPGTYQVLCAEYCGTNHSTMRGWVVALDPADYSRWLESGRAEADIKGPRDDQPSSVDRFEPPEPLSLVLAGEQAAARYGCLRCHTLDGAPHIGPTWAGLYRSTVPLQGGGTVLADEDYLTDSMMDPAKVIHAGFPSVMPSYQGILPQPETAAIVELIRSLRDVRAAAPSAAPDVPVAPSTVVPLSPPPTGPLPAMPIPTERRP
jgi:cytochrome c oxidase subunit 2